MRSLLSLVIVSVLFVSCKRAPSACTIDVAYMDTTVRPQDDFFQYACGGWIASHPMPEDKSEYDVSEYVAQNVDNQILDIITNVVNSKYKPGSINEKLAKFFKSGMDTLAIEAAGIEPIRFFLDSIDAIQSVADLQNGITLLQKHYLRSPFAIQYGPYLSNSSVMAFVISEDGVALDDVELYLDEDEYCEEVRAKYKEHQKKMFMIFGQDSVTAQKSAETTYNIEYKLAQMSLDRDQSEDRSRVIHNSSIDDLSKQLPSFDWIKFFRQLEIPIPDTIVISAEKLYLSRLDTLMHQTPIEEWKTYLKYQVINGLVTTLDSAFVNEDFDFKKRFLFGQEKKSPRWNLVVDELKIDFDDALGKMYVDKYLRPETKVRVKEMTEKLKEAMAERISKVSWMCDSTKAKALHKLSKTRLKVGCPGSFIDYSDYVMSDSYAANVIMCMRQYFKYEMSFINREIDTENVWYEILPYTVNMFAVYNQNEIVVPAAIIQPPFFYADGDDAVNYGALGAAIAHELTHGFDTRGQMYDFLGNLNDWWTDYDKEMFDKETQKLINRYNSFIVIDSMHADGKFTLCENVADLGGLVVAYEAFTKTEQWKDQTKLIDGLTPDQRFFIAYAQTWAGSYRDEAIRQRTKTNSHSLFRYRVEGPLPNIDAFEKAFNIKPEDKYYLPDSLRTNIW